jgi:hypothetical protein
MPHALDRSNKDRLAKDRLLKDLKSLVKEYSKLLARLKARIAVSPKPNRLAS